MVNTSVSRYGLTALVTEACSHLRLEQQGSARRRLVRARRRLAGAARRVLPRHAAARRRGHQRLQGRHAARHLGAGAVPAQRIGADARSAGVPGDAPARGSCAATCTTTKRWSGSNGWCVRRRATARTTRSWSRSTTRRVPGKANTGHTFGVGSLSRHVRPGSRSRPPGDRSAPPRDRPSARCSPT